MPGYNLPNQQSEWRFCKKCYVLFYDGYDEKGVCQAGGGHEAGPSSREHAGVPEHPWPYNFHIRHDVSPGALEQPDCRFCRKCFALFYDHWNIKGKCPADGQYHEAAGYNFLPSHDIPSWPRGLEYQRDWRFCRVCYAMFFDYWNLKGKCSGDPTAFGHVAEGYNFNLLWSIEMEAGDDGSP